MKKEIEPSYCDSSPKI